MQISQKQISLFGETELTSFPGGSHANHTALAAKEKAQKSFRPTSKLYEIQDWSQWPTQHPVCDGNDGLSDRLDGITFSKWRKEAIKAAGNAVVPELILDFFQVIDTMNKNQQWQTQL